MRKKKRSHHKFSCLVPLSYVENSLFVLPTQTQVSKNINWTAQQSISRGNSYPLTEYAAIGRYGVNLQ